MSVSGSLSGISFTGLASGIDTDSIVSQLMQIEALPLQRMQAQQAKLQLRQDVYGQLRSRIISLNTAAASLNVASTFNPIKASSSDTAVATVSATSSAGAGTYNLEVFKLAQAHKAASSAQADATTALGYTGSFVVNGKAVVVEASDSLTAVAQKINSASAGVTASLINGGAGNTFLTLTASATGASSEIQIGNLSGTALASLGLTTGAASVRDQVDATTIRGFGLADGTTNLATLVGTTATGSFTIGGQQINVDFSTDSLQSIADAINASGAAATATVVTETVNGKSVSLLQFSGADVPAGIVDTDGLLEALGFYQRDHANELIAAQDAEFALDGFALTSAKNSVTDVIPGATITLLQADEVDGKASTLTMVKDNNQVINAMKSFMDAYNGVIDFIRSNSSFDSETFQSGILFSDTVASQTEALLNDLVFASIGTGTYQNLTQIGFGLVEGGKLTLDTAAAEAALTSDPDAVRNLLMATGTASTSAISYVSSSTKTVNSGPAGYAVEITQAATKASMLATVAQSSPNSGETITIGGSLFGGQSYAVTVAAGTTLAELVAQINNDSRLMKNLVASIDGGALKLESKRYGAVGDFTATSNLAAGADNSGLGLAGGTFTAGLDVAGTINGEAATGSGQFLTGDTGNANTDGLQLLITATAAGSLGTIVFQRGIAAELNRRMVGLTDTVDGVMTAVDKGLQSQIDEMTARIESFNEALKIREQALKAKYLAMERAVSQLQQQMAQFSAITGQQS